MKNNPHLCTLQMSVVIIFLIYSTFFPYTFDILIIVQLYILHLNFNVYIKFSKLFKSLLTLKMISFSLWHQTHLHSILYTSVIQLISPMVTTLLYPNTCLTSSFVYLISISNWACLNQTSCSLPNPEPALPSLSHSNNSASFSGKKATYGP